MDLMKRHYNGAHFNFGELVQVEALIDAGVTEEEAYRKVLYAKQQMLMIQKRMADGGDELAKKLVVQITKELGDNVP